MAARRLVVVMLVLLFISSLAAALAPVRPGEDTTTSSTTTTTTAQPDRADAGGLVRRELDAGARRPGTVRAAVGDQLQLRVVGPRPLTVSIPGLGVTENVGPLAPAFFDFLLSDPGRYAVRILETGRPIGTIEVSREARPARTPDRAGDRRAGHER